MESVDKITTLSASVVYMLCDGCPTCRYASREMLLDARALVAESQRRGHSVSLMVVMPGNSRYGTLRGLYHAEGGTELPVFYHRGNFYQSATKLAAAIPLTITEEQCQNI